MSAHRRASILSSFSESGSKTSTSDMSFARRSSGIAIAAFLSPGVLCHGARVTVVFAPWHAPTRKHDGEQRGVHHTNVPFIASTDCVGPQLRRTTLPRTWVDKWKT